MNKKLIVIIILAGVLAMLSAIAISRLQKNSEPINPIQPAGEELEEGIVPIKETIPVKNSEPEVKPVVPKPVKQVSYKRFENTEPKASVQEEKAPELKTIVVEEAEIVSQPNVSVIQEVGSKDVIVIKECKIETPSKYSFK